MPGRVTGRWLHNEPNRVLALIGDEDLRLLAMVVPPSASNTVLTPVRCCETGIGPNTLVRNHRLGVLGSRGIFSLNRASGRCSKVRVDS